MSRTYIDTPHSDSDPHPPSHVEGCLDWCNHCVLCGAPTLYGARCADHHGVYPRSSAPVHWEGNAPTSLHGNGAASFERTTRDRAEVTCSLCLTLLGRESSERESDG